MQSWVKNLFKDSLVYGLGYGVSRFLQIIILPIIAQALSLSEFGYYSNYVIFYTIVGGFFVLGLDSAVARYFYDSDDKKYHQQLFSSAFYFILLLSIVSVSIFFLFPSGLLNLIGVPPGYENALFYVLLCIPAVTLNNFLLSWFKWKRQKYFFLINSGGSVVLLLLPLLIAERVSFVYVFQVIFWSQLSVAIVSIILASRYIRFSFNHPLMISLLKYGFPWMLVFVFGISRQYLDRAFLLQYLEDDVYGLYNFSVRISTLLSVVITAFDMSFGPLAFSIWDKEGAREFFSRLQSMYVFFISVVACAITITSPVIIDLLGGSKYAGAEKVLPILLFAAIPLSLINFSNLGTVYAKKSFLSTMSLFAGFATVLALNFLLTPVYLEYGATTASLIGHLVIVITGYFLSKKYYKVQFSYAKDAFVFLFFFAIALLCVHYPVSDLKYNNIFLQSLVLLVIVLLLLFFLYRNDYKKLLKGFRISRSGGEVRETDLAP
jgi:O-antigen/teichoic acid export membrane protein